MPTKNSKILHLLAYPIALCLIGATIWFTRPYWTSYFKSESGKQIGENRDATPVDEPKTLELNAQARANLDLVVAPIVVSDYWRKLQIPGVIEDRPGLTDRGITSPIAGVITQVHAYEGDIIQPGEKLFTLRLVSEYLQQTQSDLFKAIREVEIFNREKERIQGLIETGSLPRKRKLELDQQISRQEAKIEAFRQDLISRGLSEIQVQTIEQGQFLKSIDIFAPTPVPQPPETNAARRQPLLSFDSEKHFFEIQNLKVDLGQQVGAGQALAVLANHNSLYIKGHAFKKEASRLARAAERNWNVEIKFAEDVADDWDDIDQNFQIRHLSNTTEPNSRTFNFYIPLQNQSRVYEKEGREFVIWRFRPGQRVSIGVPVDLIKNVIVLPATAVSIEGPEAFVFQQNGDLFNRIPVEIVHRDRDNVVLANNAALSPGFFLAQNAASSLNRVLKSQAASGQQAGVHVHADGTVHAAH